MKIQKKISTLILSLSFISFNAKAWENDEDLDLENNGLQALDYPDVKPVYKARAELEVGKIPDGRVDQLKKRRESLNLWGFALGPYASRNLDTDSTFYSIAATNHREVNEKAEIRFRFGGAVAENGNAQSAMMSLGGAYLPLVTDISPLLGAEFGFGYSGGKTVKHITGFSGAALLGVRLFRTSSSQLELSGRYELIFKENEKGRPATYGMQLSFLY